MMILTLLLLLLSASSVWAAPAFEVAASTSADPTGASMSVAISPSGTNRLLTSCLVTNQVEANTTAHHFNTTENMTGVAFINPIIDDPNAKVFYLINPTTGSHDLTAEFTEVGTAAALGAIAFSGAHQTVPLGTPATHGEATDEATVTVDSAVDELVFDCFGAANNPTVTIGTTEAGAAPTVVMSRSLNVAERAALIGVSVKPAAAAASAPRRVIVID
jgi:hypothetical protein